MDSHITNNKSHIYDDDNFIVEESDDIDTSSVNFTSEETDEESNDIATYPMDGWGYKAWYGQKALDKLIKARLTRHRNIVLWEFTRCLPNLSDDARNVLFDVFTESSAFGPREHNKLLDTLADPKKGWNLQEAEPNYYYSCGKSYRPI